MPLYAFDLLADYAVDMGDETLRIIRKLWLSKLLNRSSDGIICNDHQARRIGPRLFEQACGLGLEGFVSKLGARRFSDASGGVSRKHC